jgi:hypothetical protein
VIEIILTVQAHTMCIFIQPYMRAKVGTSNPLLHTQGGSKRLHPSMSRDPFYSGPYYVHSSIHANIHNFRDWCCNLYTRSSCISAMQRWMVVLGVSVQTFALLGGYADLLRPFIWSRVSGLMRFRDGSDSECASRFVQVSEQCDGDPGND